MKRFGSTLIGLTIFVLLIAGALATSSEAAADCVKDTADAQLSILGPFGPIVGTVNFVIGGVPAVASVTINILAPPTVGEDGTLHSTSSLYYNFGNGNTLTGESKGVLSPTETPGVYQNNQDLSYTGGTGTYQNAYGRFSGHGILSFIDMTGTMSGKGVLCGLQ